MLDGQKKGNETNYGYKNHGKADSKSKLVVDYTVTSASVYDSNEFKNLVKSGDKVVYADLRLCRERGGDTK